MAEASKNLWAPWRMEYIDSLAPNAPVPACFLCHYRDHPEADRENYVLARSPKVLILLNRFPYTGGHLLVAPTAHEDALHKLSREALLELTERLSDAQRVLREALGAEGFNIGMNLGRCAGAGLPDHLHWHIVPRWSGDTNFMAVVGEARVIPQSLETVAERFRQTAARMNLDH